MKKPNYFYGPVPSRRLGFSLGVDIIPHKTCSFDCIYCQLGRLKEKHFRRKSWVDIKEFKGQLRKILKLKPKIDFLTISGSGEPTLHKNLDKIIKILKKETDNKYPVCVITNSSLLYRKEVREEILLADLIIPSLDAGSVKMFNKINNPYSNKSFYRVIEGLKKLRKEYSGSIWLEVMLIKGINDTIGEAKRIKKIVSQIKPDKLQLNSPVRPTEDKLQAPDKKIIKEITAIFNQDLKVISSFDKKGRDINLGHNLEKRILGLLKVRPENLKDLSHSLGIDQSRASKCLKSLLRHKLIKKAYHKNICFYLKNDKRKD